MHKNIHKTKNKFKFKTFYLLKYNIVNFKIQLIKYFFHTIKTFEKQK